jgi:hypothetical protein
LLKKTAAKTRAFKKEVLLKDKHGQTAWHTAAGRSQFEILSKLSLCCIISGKTSGVKD